MARDHDSDQHNVTRRHALGRVGWAGVGLLCAAPAGVQNSLNLLGRAQAAQARPIIPVIVKDKTSFYWQIVLAGARKAAQELGVDVVELGAESESDVGRQISILESVIGANPAAIVIAPTEFAALGEPIDRAAKLVKVVGIDSNADTQAFTSLLKTDNVQAGRAAADILADAIKRTYADTEGDVAMITSLPGVASLDDRANGFKAQITARYRALDIVAHGIGDAQAATGFNITMNLIEAHPELRGVFASNLAMTQGASQALAQTKTNKGGDKINLIGFDSDEKLVGLLKDGTIAALIVQDPFRMGYDGVRTAVAAVRGEHVPATFDTGFNVITGTNMNAARSQELLVPKIN
jgi:ribose transport system substrate-binding protein